MARLVIQIPCYNEAENLPAVLADVPRRIAGVTDVQILVVDDGSDDGTAEVARRHGARAIRLGRRRGLARAFTAGLEEALRMGADVIVNTDGDNQYRADDIPGLIAPVIEGRAELVVGCRDIAGHGEFGTIKKILQYLGSRVVGGLAGLSIPDATSGFRAFSRDAAFRMIVVSRFSYTLETLIQAGHDGISVAWVPIRVNPSRRPSRLFRSIPHYVVHSAATIIRAYTTYASLRVFTAAGAATILIGAAGVGRFLYLFFRDPGYSGHVQSLVLSAALLVLGFQTLLMGLLSDLVAVNRKLSQEMLYRLRRRDIEGGG